MKPKKKKKKRRISVKNLQIRLQSLIKEQNIEIIHLALESILEEIEEQ